MSSTQYALLGLDRALRPSTQDVNTAYRRLALQFHPDKNIEDTTAEFQALNAANKAVLAHIATRPPPPVAKAPPVAKTPPFQSRAKEGQEQDTRGPAAKKAKAQRDAKESRQQQERHSRMEEGKAQFMKEVRDKIAAMRDQHEASRSAMLESFISNLYAEGYERGFEESRRYRTNLRDRRTEKRTSRSAAASSKRAAVTKPFVGVKSSGASTKPQNERHERLSTRLRDLRR